MYDPHRDDPYRQYSLPYEPNTAYVDPAGYQQQQYTPRPQATRPRPESDGSLQPRLSKAEALEFVGKCKRWLVAGSIVAFALLGGLAAGHAVGTSANANPPAANPPSAQPATPTPADPGGGFFQQQGGGPGFGNSNSSQQPVSGSSVSAP
jgi:hypothetical protein